MLWVIVAALARRGLVLLLPGGRREAGSRTRSGALYPSSGVPPLELQQQQHQRQRSRNLTGKTNGSAPVIHEAPLPPHLTTTTTTNITTTSSTTTASPGPPTAPSSEKSRR